MTYTDFSDGIVPDVRIRSKTTRVLLSSKKKYRKGDKLQMKITYHLNAIENRHRQAHIPVHRRML